MRLIPWKVSEDAREHESFCYECFQKVDGGFYLEIGVRKPAGSDGCCVRARLCTICTNKLRSLIRRRRRALNPRIRLAIHALEHSPALMLKEEELRRAVGRYATNTIKSLVARGFASRSHDGETIVLEAKGRLALRSPEVADAR